MSGDFSRSTFDPKKHYSGVRMQQGRVQVDADWNEQVDIAAEAVRARTRDIVGWSGGPSGTAGFEIRAESVLVLGGHGDLVEAPPREEYALREGDHVTIEAVVAPRPGGAGGPIFSAGHLLLSLEGGRLSFRHGAVGAAVTTQPLAWDAPRHVVAAYDGRAMRIHVDAQEVSGKSVAAGPRDPAIEIVEELEAGTEAVELFSSKPRRRGVALRIGGTQPDGAASFDGTIGSVRVFRAALSPADVAALRSRPLPDEALLIASFALDEGHGGHARDLSPLRNDARLIGPEGRRPRWHCAALRIGAGRYYVGGMLCENEAAVSFEAQPDLPGERIPQAHGTYLAVLDVWERVVGSLEDPHLLEVALGGVDTAVRTKLVWQVRLLRGTHHDRGESALAALASKGAMRARPTSKLDLEGNRLYRVEIHDDGDAAGSPLAERGEWIEVTVDAKDPATVHAKEALLDPARWRPGRWVEVWGRGAPLLTTITALDAGARRVTLAKAVSPGTGHLRLRRIASYKWSRNNALDELPIDVIDGKSVTLKEPVGYHGVALHDAKSGDGKGGDWVEILGDRELLRGDPGPLVRIDAIDDERTTLTLRDAVPAGAGQGDRASIKRWDWDRRRGTPGQGIAPVTTGPADAWTALERGIEVQFTGPGPYRTGEHWLLPARVQSCSIEWPEDAAGPASCAPEGIHRFARLGLVRIGEDGISVEDLRSTFVPLADLRVPGAELVGPITIRGPLHVEGPVVVDEEARARGLAGQLPPGVVETGQLVDRAVTAPKLAPHAVEARHLAEGLGFVPEGFAILGSTPVPPPGYVYAHQHIEVKNPSPAWRPGPALPPDHAGRVVLVTVGESLYALCEKDREILRHDETEARWVKVGEMLAHRRGFAAAAVGDEIHVVGGVDQHGLARADHEIFDTKAGGTARPAGERLTRARTRLGLAAVGGYLFAIGGLEFWLPWRLRDALVGLGLPRSWFHPRTSSDAVEVYEPRHRRWRVLTPMPTPRSDFGVGVLHDRIHVVGGRSQGLFFRAASILRDHEVFTPARNRWDPRMPLPAPCAEPGAAIIEGQLYVTGGLGPDGPLATVASFAPRDDTWHPAPALPAARHDHGATGLFGDVFVAGGRLAKGLHAGVDWCPMASTLFVHRKVAPAGYPPSHPAHEALPHATPAHLRRQDLAPPPGAALPAALPSTALDLAPQPATLRRWALLLAIGGLIAAIVYGYWGFWRR